MIEKILMDYLQSNIDVPVYMEKPSMFPGEYILIEKTGSGLNDRIESAMVAIQSYSGSMTGAVELNERMKSVMLDAAELDEIGSCRLNSDYNFTDTSTKEYRYQAVFNITYYGG